MKLRKSEKLVLSRLVRVKKGAEARKSDVAMPSDRSSQARSASGSLGSYLGLLGCDLVLLGNCS